MSDVDKPRKIGPALGLLGYSVWKVPRGSSPAVLNLFRNCYEMSAESVLRKNKESSFSYRDVLLGIEEWMINGDSIYSNDVDCYFLKQDEDLSSEYGELCP